MIRGHLFSSTSVKASMSHFQTLCGWAQHYCRHIVVLACLSCCRFAPSLKYVIEMSLWKAEIKTLFLQDIMSTVWVDGGKAGTKDPVVVHGLWAESISVRPCIDPSHPFWHTGTRKEQRCQRRLSQHHTNSYCLVRVRGSVKFSDHVN